MYGATDNRKEKKEAERRIGLESRDLYLFVC